VGSEKEKSIKTKKKMKGSREVEENKHETKGISEINAEVEEEGDEKRHTNRHLLFLKAQHGMRISMT
jgi:hypothetical protein